ncbi:MAG: LysR family transcriptional regulator, partial [Pseudomonadota bacterium]|nr:LysR family transcriptional regulator [Pseudomonadota bacterium]
MADRRLQVFVTVAKKLSFTKAAEALHMTQPAVTFQIRQLEEYFNTRLFDRTHNRISLTDAGELVKRYADQIIDLYKEMDNAVRTLTGDVQGPLVVGASTTIGEYVIPELLGEYQAKYPNVKMQLNVANTTGIIHMVENNDIDVGIVEGPISNKNLISKVCWEDELMVICAPGHPLTKKKPVTAQALTEYPFIGREEGSGTRDVFWQRLGEQKIDPADLNITMEFGSPESIKNAVAAGLGISVLSAATLSKELQLGRLAAMPFSPPIRRPF